MTQEYRIALAEVNCILKKSSKDVIKKIPYRFRKYIITNMDKTHKINLQTDLPLERQNIKEKTKDILALMYRDYIVSSEEREKLIKVELENQKKFSFIKQQKIKNYDIFKKKEKLHINENLPIEVKQEDKFAVFIKKCMNKIISFFKEK